MLISGQEIQRIQRNMHFCSFTNSERALIAYDRCKHHKLISERLRYFFPNMVPVLETVRDSCVTSSSYHIVSNHFLSIRVKDG